MPSHTAVRIHDDFPPCDASVAFRSADDKTARRIDQVGRLFVQPFLWHHFLDQKFGQSFPHFLLFYVFGVL